MRAIGNEGANRGCGVAPGMRIGSSRRAARLRRGLALGLALGAGAWAHAAWAVSVSLTAPSNSVIAAPATIALAASATPGAGRRILRVDFFQGTTRIGTATSAPYSVTWSNVPRGNYVLSATAIDSGFSLAVSNQVLVRVDTPPTVSLTDPANNAVFAPGANIALAAAAADPDGVVTKVEFFAGGTLLGTQFLAPYNLTWNNVPAGRYTLTARATDLVGLTTTAPVTIAVRSALAQIYYIHTDHLNTPRMIADQAGNTVWRNDNTEPFGDSVPNDNPSGLGAFDFPLRFPGQYFDRETNLAYNMARDYSSQIGRYVQSDPIGLKGGLNTYAYVDSDPLGSIDPFGLVRVKVYEVRRGVQIFFWSSLFSKECERSPGSCGSFHERYRLSWTAEASDSCVLTGTETTVVNGPTKFFASHMEWWQATHTWWKYGSRDNCSSCTLTDYRFEEKETPFPHPGPESLN